MMLTIFFPSFSFHSFSLFLYFFSRLPFSLFFFFLFYFNLEIYFDHFCCYFNIIATCKIYPWSHEYINRYIIDLISTIFLAIKLIFVTDRSLLKLCKYYIIEVYRFIRLYLSNSSFCLIFLSTRFRIIRIINFYFTICKSHKSKTRLLKDLNQDVRCH